MTPKVSVIVPVYKAEAYLHRCVDSILAQTFQNFEVLLIDDGSPDKSGDICDEYAKRDSRVRVFHKENGGVSSARNLGLENAIGERIVFIDSDDWVDATYLTSFMQEDADIVVQGFRATNWPYIVYEEKNNWVDVKVESINGKQDSILLFLSKLSEIHNLGYLWCRSFKREIIEKFNLRFNENYRLKEDEDFIFRYLLYIKTYAIVDYIGYNYIAPIYGIKYRNIDADGYIDCSMSIINSMISLGLDISHPLVVEGLGLLGGQIFDKYRRKHCNLYTMNEQIEKFNSYVCKLQNPFWKLGKKCFFLKIFAWKKTPMCLHLFYKRVFCLLDEMN